MGGRGRGGAREGMEGGAWAGPGRAGPGLDPPLPTWLMLGCPCFFLEAVSRPQREEKRLRRLLVERDMACVRRLTPVSAVRAATCGRGQRGGVRGRPSPRTHHRTLPRQRSSPQPAPPLPPEPTAQAPGPPWTRVSMAGGRLVRVRLTGPDTEQSQITGRVSARLPARLDRVPRVTRATLRASPEPEPHGAAPSKRTPMPGQHRHPSGAPVPASPSLPLRFLPFPQTTSSDT